MRWRYLDCTAHIISNNGTKIIIYRRKSKIIFVTSQAEMSLHLRGKNTLSHNFCMTDHLPFRKIGIYLYQHIIFIRKSQGKTR